MFGQHFGCPVRKAKVEILEGQLNYFIMYEDKTPHEMFN
jgi:hypothetical protein